MSCPICRSSYCMTEPDIRVRMPEGPVRVHLRCLQALIRMHRVSAGAALVAWVIVPSYPGYLISTEGAIRSQHTGDLLRQRDDGRGYLCVDLYRGGKKSTLKIHRLVSDAFRGPLPARMHVDHIDGDKRNNRLENLRWRPASENSSDCRRGSRAGVGPLSDEQRAAIEVLTAHGWTSAAIARATRSSVGTVRRMRRRFALV